MKKDWLSLVDSLLKSYPSEFVLLRQRKYPSRRDNNQCKRWQPAMAGSIGMVMVVDGEGRICIRPAIRLYRRLLRLALARNVRM